MESGCEYIVNRQKLIEDNINLVYYIVSHDYPTYLRDEDIIQSGMLGLCKAANAWGEQGTFSTYAGKCIRNEIGQEFIRRKSHSKDISLESTVNETTTIGDLLVGEEDCDYMEDELFYRSLTKEEQEVLTLTTIGFTNNEISNMRGDGIPKIQKILRTIKIKRRNFYGN